MRLNVESVCRRARADAVILICGMMWLTIGGCGSGDSLRRAAVRGTVTHHGKLLDRGTVVFLPEPGTPGPPAVGAIQADGSYQLVTAGKTGASIGRHRVLVQLHRQPTKAEERQMGVVFESLIPEKYSRDDETPLRYEVKAGTNQYLITVD